MTPPQAMAVPSRATRALLADGIRRLQAAGIERPKQEAAWVLGHLLGVGTPELYLRDGEVGELVAQQFLAHVEARVSGTPLQYLLGEAEFFGERVAVEPGVFIPRPETEAIVAAALERLRQRQATVARSLRLLDLGTGTGCIAITLARHLPACVVVGVEVSWTAVCIARTNVLRHRLSSRVHLVQGRWAQGVSGLFDGIVSNPPYIPSAQVNRLPLDVRREPRVSLDGGPNGLRDLAHLLEEGPRLLERGGVLALECAEEHVGTLAERARRAAWVSTVESVTDLAGRPRGVLIARA